MSGINVKGWCPGAYRPMMSGDGLIVRVRPVLGRLTREQVLGLCDLAVRYANGSIDLTNRANLQLRGVSEDDHQPLLDDLFALGLLDEDPESESRRNIVTTPFWQAGDTVDRIGRHLIEDLSRFPQLPAKFGFAVDCGPVPVLSETPADIRIETGIDTENVIVRADGAGNGIAVSPDAAVNTVFDMVKWFAANRGDVRRMRPLINLLPQNWRTHPRKSPASVPQPGSVAGGCFLGAAFGAVDARILHKLLAQTDVSEIRVTPWRMIFLPGIGDIADACGLIAGPSPLLGVNACPGLPYCTSSTVETRRVARALAELGTDDLHVSGCAKGCAYPRKAGATLVGRDGKFDLVQNGCSWDEPRRRGLDPEKLISGAERV